MTVRSRAQVRGSGAAPRAPARAPGARAEEERRLETSAPPCRKNRIGRSNARGDRQAGRRPRASARPAAMALDPVAMADCANLRAASPPAARRSRSQANRCARRSAGVTVPAASSAPAALRIAGPRVGRHEQQLPRARAGQAKGRPGHGAQDVGQPSQIATRFQGALAFTPGPRRSKASPRTVLRAAQAADVVGIGGGAAGEGRGAGDQHVGAGGDRALPRRLHVDAAIDLEIDARPAAVRRCAGAARRSCRAGGDEALAAEAGIDRSSPASDRHRPST